MVDKNGGEAATPSSKRGRPQYEEVYCTASLIKTSKGPMHHGDRKRLPPEEVQELRRRGFVE